MHFLLNYYFLTNSFHFFFRFINVNHNIFNCILNYSFLIFISSLNGLKMGFVVKRFYYRFFVFFLTKLTTLYLFLSHLIVFVCFKWFHYFSGLILLHANPMDISQTIKCHLNVLHFCRNVFCYSFKIYPCRLNVLNGYNCSTSFI